MSSPSTSYEREPQLTAVTNDPAWSMPKAAAFCVASVAAFFAMGWSLGGYLYDRLSVRSRE